MPLTTWLAAQGQPITPEGRPDDMPIDWPTGCSPWRFPRQASWRLTNPDGSRHAPDWLQTALQHADAEHEPQHLANRVITAVIGGGQQAQALTRRIIASRRSREVAWPSTRRQISLAIHGKFS